MSGSVPHLSHSVSMQPHHPLKSQPPRLRFVSSVEFKHSSGETSTTPLSPESPADDSSSENHKPRLQRSKAQSRKTFRYKRGRPSHYGEGSSLSSTNTQISVAPSSQPAAQSQSHLLQANIPQEVPEVSVKQPLADISWDSVSQTSSTSGYRDNYSLQTGFLSPDGSLTGCTLTPVAGMERTGSQHSLLMLFETQDEDTLI